MDEKSSLISLQQLAVLQQLSSPALPIGGFTYSQGLEGAVELGIIHDEESTKDWIMSQLHGTLVPSDATVWLLLYEFWLNNEIESLVYWNNWFFASRETIEVRQETIQMGKTLAKLAEELSWGNSNSSQLSVLLSIEPITLPLAHSYVCSIWSIPKLPSVAAYIYTWLENQVTAAIKSVPLGQLAGQRVLNHVREQIPHAVADALRRAYEIPPDLQTFSPQYSIVSSRHESQFSRLFRS